MADLSASQSVACLASPACLRPGQPPPAGDKGTGLEGASSVGGGGDELGERGQAVEEVLCSLLGHIALVGTLCSLLVGTLWVALVGTLCSLLGHIALVGTKQRDGRSGDLLRTCC